MMKNLLLAGVAASLLSACATSPDQMRATYVSPVQYSSYSCQQIENEMRRSTQQVAALQGSLKSKADGDAAQMAVGMILFWPALFFLEGGDGPEAEAFAVFKDNDSAKEFAKYLRTLKDSGEFGKAYQYDSADGQTIEIRSIPWSDYFSRLDSVNVDKVVVESRWI